MHSFKMSITAYKYVVKEESKVPVSVMDQLICNVFTTISLDVWLHHATMHIDRNCIVCINRVCVLIITLMPAFPMLSQNEVFRQTDPGCL